MSTVTQRIKEIKQPRGGYVKVKDMDVTFLEDSHILNVEENIHASLIGLSVDYLSRYMTGASIEDAFFISLKGANNIKKLRKAKKLAKKIKGLDDKSIINAVKLTGFDVCYRAGIAGYVPVRKIRPNKETIENIRIMVNRSIEFFKYYGPVIMDGFSFEGGYTSLIHAGDGDFLTEDTLWDFKVLKQKPNKDHTLQLLIYWRMGVHSIYPEFRKIRYIGIFNPRLNTIYKFSLDNVSKETIKEIDTKIIGYKR